MKAAMTSQETKTSFKKATLAVIFVLAYLSTTINSRTVPIFGNGSIGYYFVNIYLGEQAQPASVIIDTGSSLTCLPCTGSLKTNKDVQSVVPNILTAHMIMTKVWGTLLLYQETHILGGNASYNQTQLVHFLS
jgi:hypothetical protein